MRRAGLPLAGLTKQYFLVGGLMAQSEMRRGKAVSVTAGVYEER